jgi:hypothetical protein
VLLANFRSGAVALKGNLIVRAFWCEHVYYAALSSCVHTCEQCERISSLCVFIVDVEWNEGSALEFTEIMSLKACVVECNIIKL